MKILQISDIAYPHIGGIERTVYKYGKEFVRNGHESYVLTSSFEKTKKIENIENTVYHRVPKYLLPFFSMSLKDFDIIHSHSYLSFYSLNLYKEIHRKKIIFKHIHSIYGKNLRAYTGWNISKILSIFEESLIKGECDAYIVPSNFTKNMIKNFEIDKDIYVINHGPEYDSFPDKKEARKILGIKDEEFIIGFVGRISYGKGPQDIVKIIPEILKYNRNVRLLLIGPNPTLKTSGIMGIRENLEKMVKEMGIENNVEFLGFVEDEKMPYYYSSMDVFVMPSRNEGFGISIVNAMSAGVPVIAYDNTAIPETVGDGGILIPTGDTEKIKEWVLKIMENEEIRKMYSEKAIKRSREFDWSKNVKKLIEIYSSYL
ncbi:MAG: glycosyltransferase family 4 protein [Thermoplasmata archaeon]